jgi:hypothetical protein
MTTEWNWDASVAIFPVSPPKIETLLGFIVYQVYLNEDEDDVTRKKIGGCGGCNFADRKELRAVIPVASQRFPAWVPASKLLPCVPLANP